MNLNERAEFIKSESRRLGFSSCGISCAVFLEDEAPRLEKWLKEGRNGNMQYMENHFDKRLDPRLLVDGAKSVISLLFNYHNPQKPAQSEDFRISQYAYGEDYHVVVKEKLFLLLQSIQSTIGDVNGRAFVDSAPVLEKAWAVKSGLGWLGKNGNIIHKKAGSYFFLAELIIDLELAYDSPVTDHCGSCTACIDACPTQAIYQPHQVDGSKCISYLTIELKESIPTSFKNTYQNWIFGCDICMDVCPWNRFAKPTNEPKFQPHPDLLGMKNQDWLEISEETFGKLFGKSAVKRTKYNGLKRNIDFISNKK
jgi:epoxyqueuosine reductase